MDIFEQKDGHLETSLSWKKVERDNTKTGYREGVSDGRKENYQGSFDIGYSDGFTNAFLMGKYKGKLKAADLKNNTSTAEESLHETRKGSCCMCKDKNLIDKSIEEIKSKQGDRMNVLTKNICSKYKDVIR